MKPKSLRFHHPLLGAPSWTAMVIATLALLCGLSAPAPATAAASRASPPATTTAAPAAKTAAAPLAKPATCKSNPLGARGLYLRGGFNNWAADEAQRLRWNCHRFELVNTLSGPQTFKFGDEAWSADADFGAAGGDGSSEVGATPVQLAAKGKELHHLFTGTQRIILDMTQSISKPTLAISACPTPPRQPTLFLRGGMNNWTALEDYAFQYSCDAWYLNVKLQGRQEFKIADAAWTDAASYGAHGTATLRPAAALALGRATAPGGIGNLAFVFSGEHTLRLAFPGGQPMLTIGAKSFADPAEQAVANPVALSLRHDSRALADRAPFGAITDGSTVAFAIHADAGVDAMTLVIERRRMEGNQDLLEYLQPVRLPMAKAVDSAGGVRWTARHAFAGIGIYGYYFQARIGGRDYVYQNNRDAVHWTREKGSNGLGRVEEAGGSGKGIRRYRLTVYRADFKVPDWARDAIYYYIFPDRFRNGDPGNDPRPGVDKYHDGTVELHKNWLDRPYKPDSGDGSDAAYNNDFFGGDIAGIIDKLDYIAGLGANTLYITPLFTAASNHKYDTADYRSIDPHFGSNADFSRLTAAAAERGIRVISDASLNHTGRDSLYFNRFGNYGQQGAFDRGRIHAESPYADWYSFDPGQADPDKQYKGWVGVVDLPELNKASASFRRFAYGADDSVMKLWLDRGASGWRMDVAPWVPDDFWREWRTAIKQHRPDALTVAETWFDASKYFLGDTFDSTMNYIFRSTVLDYAGGGSAIAGYHNIEFMREAYPPQAFAALMNLLSTHDVARSLHVLGHQGTDTPAAKIAESKRRLLLAMFFQMTFPGAPAIYYGDEVGVTGGEDPFNRGSYPWADRGGSPDLQLLGQVKALVQLRRDHPVLRHGSLQAPLLIDEHLIVLARQDRARWAITASNNAVTAGSATLQLPAGMPRHFRDAISGVDVDADDNGRLQFPVPALFGRVLISR